MQSVTGQKPVDEVYITKDLGVFKKIFKLGDPEDPIPEKGQEVLVKYQGRLEDGSIFDSSDKHGEPLKIVIGTG